MRYTIILCIVFFNINIQAQLSGNMDPLAGKYLATFNGDHLTLGIEKKSGSSYTGFMNDSYQTYTLTLDLSGTTISGVAKERTMGLEFQIAGQIRGAQLPLSFTVEVQGEKNTMEVVFIREGSEVQKPSGTESQDQAKVVFPSGASHPQELLGTWTKEELYQSGQGDSYMGASSSESMTFLAGGRMAEAGSTATISGSNYSGQSSGQGTGVIPGLAWYTITNQLYLQVTENGQTQNVHLGKFYVENNNMLITGANGEKILLSRSN